jgi:predicted nucleotidyltransferase/uncharacterized protein (UPF0332 family)
MVKKVVARKGAKRVKKAVKSRKDELPTMRIAGERDIAMDFAMKVYEKFDQMIKSIVLFGSSAKKVAVAGSDIDIIVIIDDVSLRWDEELIAWYREELGKIITVNPYRKSLHVNTIKLSTWWDDMMRGDPVVINVLRYGDALIDYGGFFNPLRILLKEGKIRPTPESIYTLLQRAPGHMMRARQSMNAVLDGLYWCMVDAAHAALISAGVQPASPEDVGKVLGKTFVDGKMMKRKFVGYYEEVHDVMKAVAHGERIRIRGKDLDVWFEKADDFLGEMAKLVDICIEKADNAMKRK